MNAISDVTCEIITFVTVKLAVLWDVALSSCAV